MSESNADNLHAHMSGGNGASEAWYTGDGPETDVVLSTRVRIARNLSGYRFPALIKSDDAESVLSLVFDTFNHLENPDQYQMVRMSNIDILGRRILAERGILDPDSGNEPWRGVIIRNDGVLSATVNIADHVRLAAFTSGLSIFECSAIVLGMETAMQKNLQFSAMQDTGFLTSNLFDSGSGMKISVLLSLSGLCMTGLLERVIKEFLSLGLTIKGYYGLSGETSLGCLYQLSNTSSCEGDSASLIARMEQASGKLAELERKSRKELMANRPTALEDAVFRAITTAKYARFISLPEAVEIIQRVKLGLDCALVKNTTHPDLTALLYRVQSAHIGFVISGGSVIIEKDVVSDELRMDRLRAMVIQEVLKDADIIERR
jgi:protein arginine kinase